MADETNALHNEEVQHLLERGEAAGFLESTDISEVLDTLELEASDVELVHRELEERNDRGGRGRQGAAAGANGSAPGLRGPRDDDRRPPALPAGDRTPSASDRRRRGRALQAHRARRHGGEAADDRVQPAPGRLDREELPQPGPPLPRPHPGRDVRPHPRRREVRVAAGPQVLDVRDLVDPPGRRPRDRRQGADDPRARPRRRAHAEDAPRRAPPLDAARPRADARGDRARGRPAARSRRSRSGRPPAPRRASTSRSASRRTRSSATSSPARTRFPKKRPSGACRRKPSTALSTRCPSATAVSSSFATGSAARSRTRWSTSAAGSASRASACGRSRSSRSRG